MYVYIHIHVYIYMYIYIYIHIIIMIAIYIPFKRNYIVPLKRGLGGSSAEAQHLSAVISCLASLSVCLPLYSLYMLFAKRIHSGI